MLLITLSLAIGVVSAQKVKFKKGDVIIEDVSCLNYERSDANNIEISTKDGSQTILLKYIRTGVGPNEGLYTKITFVEQEKSLTTRSQQFTKKRLVKKLLEEGLIVDCQFNEEELDKFIMKYDEQIEETLIRR